MLSIHEYTFMSPRTHMQELQLSHLAAFLMTKLAFLLTHQYMGCHDRKSKA